MCAEVVACKLAFMQRTAALRDCAVYMARPLDVLKARIYNEQVLNGPKRLKITTLFMVDDENLSLFASENIHKFAPRADWDDEDFEESNLMHMINGFVYGNGPRLTVRAGTRVRWYLVSLGTEVDLHTPHWHAATVLEDGHRTDVVELLPASMHTVDMLPDNVGSWMFHCHVNDHIAAGMSTLYDILPAY